MKPLHSMDSRFSGLFLVAGTAGYSPGIGLTAPVESGL